MDTESIPTMSHKNNLKEAKRLQLVVHHLCESSWYIQNGQMCLCHFLKLVAGYSPGFVMPLRCSDPNI